MKHLTFPLFAGAAAAALMLAAPTAEAIEPAAKGKTPANPVFIISVPNAGSAWSGFSRSPLGRTFTDVWWVDHMRQDPNLYAFFQQRPKLESQLGLSLSPDELFTQTIIGFDVYGTAAGGDSGLGATITFRDGAAAHKIIDQMKKESTASRGTGFGNSATATADKTENEVRRVSFPAFSIYTAIDGNQLVVANTAKMLESAMNNEGGGIFDSQKFRNHMGPIENDEHNAWVYFDYESLPANSGFSGPTLDAVRAVAAGAVIDLQAGHFKATAFRPRQALTPGWLRWSATAPPAGSINLLEALPGEPFLAFAMNNFDGDLMIDSAASAEMGGVKREQVDESFAQAQRALGFDVRGDVIANLGPEMAIALTDLKAMSGAVPQGGLLFAAQLRDPGSFRAALDVVRDQVNAMMAPPSQPGQPRQEIESFSVQVRGADEVVTFNHQALSSSGYSPAYSITSSGVFVLGSSSALVEETIDRLQMGGDSLASSRHMQRGRQVLSGRSNVMFFIKPESLLPLVDAGAMDQLGSMTPVDMKSIQDLRDFLRSMTSVLSTMTFSSEGMKLEAAVLM